MELYDSLFEKYGYNEPIFTHDITFNDYSKPWIYKELNRLCEEGKLIRYDKGVYYIPRKTPFGNTRLDSAKVINRKYVKAGEETVGYYSGNTLLNLMNLSTQVPNSIEIYTNNEKSKMREVKIGKQSVILRRARTTVTKDNAAVQQFLELMNFTDAKFYDAERKEIVRQFIQQNGITREEITRYAPVFPDKAMRNLVESEVIYNVAP